MASSFGGGGMMGSPRPQMGAMINPQRRVSASPGQANMGPMMGGGPAGGGPATPRWQMSQPPPSPQGGPPMGQPPGMGGPPTPRMAMAQGTPPMAQNMPTSLPPQAQGNAFGLDGPKPGISLGWGRPQMGSQINPMRPLSPPPMPPPPMDPNQQYSMMGDVGLHGGGPAPDPYSMASTRSYDGSGGMNGESPFSEGLNRKGLGSAF